MDPIEITPIPLPQLLEILKESPRLFTYLNGKLRDLVVALIPPIREEALKSIVVKSDGLDYLDPNAIHCIRSGYPTTLTAPVFETLSQVIKIRIGRQLDKYIHNPVNWFPRRVSNLKGFLYFFGPFPRNCCGDVSFERQEDGEYRLMPLRASLSRAVKDAIKAFNWADYPPMKRGIVGVDNGTLYVITADFVNPEETILASQLRQVDPNASPELYDGCFVFAGNGDVCYYKLSKPKDPPKPQEVSPVESSSSSDEESNNVDASQFVKRLPVKRPKM